MQKFQTMMQTMTQNKATEPNMTTPLALHHNTATSAHTAKYVIASPTNVGNSEPTKPANSQIESLPLNALLNVSKVGRRSH